MNILVTGGCGFIGTQVVDRLLASGYNVTVVDREVGSWSLCKVVEDDYLAFLHKTEEKYDTIVHLAAEHLVGQSMLDPAKYYENNVVKLKGMLDYMVAAGTQNIIFSSSGNVYGRQGSNSKLSEDIYYDPENPYASSKVAGELLIKDYARAYGINYVTFRYFNAAGADPRGRFGYTQDPPTHIIPIICRAIKNNKTIQIFGTDYPTKDGTCVRDYVHVSDIADAHVKAIGLLKTGLKNETFNLGGGSEGVSVLDIVAGTFDVFDKSVEVEYLERRSGDPAILVADITKAREVLKWSPKYSVKDAIQHAWRWENESPNTAPG